MKYLVLGVGLTLENKLKKSKETSIRVLEKENETGGLCLSVDVDGSSFDIGGCHFLDSRKTNVTVDLAMQLADEFINNVNVKGN